MHIYQVTNKPKGGVDGWQLARIDFKEQINSVQVAEIRNVLHAQKGIKHSLFNAKEDVLIYAFDPTEQQSEAVFNVLQKETPYKTERYVVSAGDLAGSCPVINKNSITYRISSGFQKLFKSN